jgi:phosphoacetylglucosamine mutase
MVPLDSVQSEITGAYLSDVDAHLSVSRGDTLESTLFRIGILAVLRSKKLNGQTIGVMITASHNPAIDNGAKLVDPRGEMLEASWEQHASLLANAETTSDLLKAITGLIPELKIDMSKPSRVVFGRDTRPSGEKLVKALQAGLEAMGCDEPKDMGITTTPCLHYMVKGSNLKQEAQIKYGAPSEQGYVQKLATAFTKLMVSSKLDVQALIS